MKHVKLLNLSLVASLLAFAAAGCKKNPGYTTNLPGQKPNVNNTDLNNGRSIGGGNPMKSGEAQFVNTPGGGEQSSGHPNWIEDASALKSQTIYFDYDKSSIRSAEESKLQEVVSYLKSHPGAAVRIEGNCDERGTEEYNRSLGDRRALSAREALVGMGLNPQDVDTKTWGEDNSANAPGHDEAAWSKNRRDDFIILTAPK